MVVAIKSSSTAPNNSNNIVLPAGIVSGDLIMLFVGNYSSPATMPTGWTQLRAPISSTGTYIDYSHIWYKVSGGSDSSTTVSISGLSTAYCGVHSVVLSGAGGTPTFNESSQGENSDLSTSTTGLLTVSKPSKMLYFWSNMAASGTAPTANAPTGGLAPLTFVNSVRQNGFHSSYLYTAPNIYNGGTTSSNITYDLAGSVNGSIVAVHEPNAAPTAATGLTATNSPVPNGTNPAMSWTFNDTDAGATQSAYQIRWRRKD